MATLFLIDGHNVLYRTFFGVPRLTAPDGTPTNVVLGTARILLKILREEKPAAIAAVFDSPGTTFRHELYPEYKANRLKIPEDLSAQIPLVKEVIDALGVPRVEVQGVEADDLIGTLSRMAEEKGMDVVIVSSDKDLYQLVSPKVRLRDGLKERQIGEAEVREAFGVEPRQVVDLLALAGDPSDNVPGVPGIGEKTASEMIREFDSLGNLLRQVDRLKGSRREKIEKHAEEARLCRTLVEIDRGAPVGVGLSDLRPGGMHVERISALFMKLGFRKLLDDLDLAGPPALPLGGGEGHASRRWRKAGMTSDFVAAIGIHPPRRAALVTGGDKEGIAGIAVDGGDPWILPASQVPGAMEWFGKNDVKVYVYDGKWFLRRYFPAGGREGATLFDVQVAGYLLSPDDGTPALSNLFGRYLPAAVAAGEGEAHEPRAAARAEAILALGKTVEEKLGEAGLSSVFRDIDMPLLPVLLRMEEAGIRIDPEQFRRLSGELAEATAAIQGKVAAIAGEGFNVNSPKQLAFLLFEKLGLPPVKKTKTGYSTDMEVLEQLKGAHEIPALILEYRTLAKIRSTYVDVLPGMVDPGDGRIHTTFNQTQAATGRLSSSDPNLQNIPIRTDLGKRIRAGFIAGEGNLFVGADYSQVELRLLAHLSGDVELTREFRSGGDIHTATAVGVFGVPVSEVTPDLRRRAKVINFGILYGMSPFGLSRELGIGGREAKQYIEQYFARFPAVREYMEGLKETARRDGYVQTILGRRRYLRDIDSRNKVLREAAERMAINAPIQGSAADIIKMAMIRVDRELRDRGMGARLILQVHDELIAEAPEREAGDTGRIVKEAMEGVVTLSVPLTVSVSAGKHWGEIH